jgi:phosphohistidine phosphatase
VFPCRRPCRGRSLAALDRRHLLELYLVRHAIAFERDDARWPDDSKRPLSPEGEARSRVASRGLKRIVPTVDVVLSSQFVRAWRTAELLAEEAGWPAPEPVRALEPGQRVTRAATALRGYSDRGSVAVVGHEPNLSELAAHLLAGAEDDLAIEVKKGGVVCLGLDGGVRSGSAWLRWSVTPKILRALASRPR